MRALIVAALPVLIIIGVIYLESRRQPNYPDETAAGLELLSKEFRGSGYFHRSVSDTNPPNASHPDYYITVDEALAQLSRIQSERGLSTNNAPELEHLISQLAEPPESRAVGETKVNVLRLNLALEQFKPKP